MKSKIFIALIMITSPSFAQQQNTAEAEPLPSVHSSGVRLGFLLGPRNLTTEKPNRMFGADKEFMVAQSNVGISLGYGQLPVKQLGWTASGAMMRIGRDGATTTLYRIDGNLAYAFDQYFHFKGGLNLSNILKGSGDANFKMGVGSQLSVGYTYSKWLSFELATVGMNQSGTVDEVDVKTQVAGLELSVYTTF